jgi:hypothetical protein
MPNILFKVVIYDDAIQGEGTVKVLDAQDKELPGASLSAGVDGVAYIEHIEILTTRDSKGVLKACVHKRCNLYGC